ncbi:MAG: hypothetical protein WBZ36_17615 [Candidatus Nitrosopolaris sp.]
MSGTTIEEMSRLRGEHYWMREFRLRSYDKFMTKPTPKWGCDLSKINFHNICLHTTTSEKIVDMYDKSGNPKATGVVETEYEEAYRKQNENLAKEGVIFVNIETAVKKYPELIEKYFGKIIPPEDNKFAALNSAIWSGGSFIYLPYGMSTIVGCYPL